MTEIPTDEGKLYLATVLVLFSRKLLASPTAEHPDAELAGDAIKMAAAVRGGRTVIDGVIFRTDRGSTYTAKTDAGRHDDGADRRRHHGRRDGSDQ